MRDQNIGMNQVREWGGTICFAAKWMGKRPVFFHSDWTDGHEGMLAAMHDLWSQADAVCGYNNDRFDNKKMRGEFVRHDMTPPPPVASIDLYKVVRQQFSFDSHKLDHVSQLLGIGNKVKHEGHGLWSAVLEGDIKARKTMERYNCQDVRLTEKLYKKLRPYINNHPHLGVGNSEACPSCGSLDAQRRGSHHTRHFVTQRLQCTNCGHWYLGKKVKRQARDMAA
ncbi:MAG: ribonuclease H-like domain-containing protein [Pseudomonadota bacterium]